MASESPYAKTKHVLTEDGWTVGRTEHWNAFAKIRQDLFGFADMVAIKPGEPITAIQVTSAAHHSERRTKILENLCARVWHAAGGRILVWSWLKKRGHWGQRVETIVPESPAPPPAPLLLSALPPSETASKTPDHR